MQPAYYFMIQKHHIGIGPYPISPTLRHSLWDPPGGSRKPVLKWRIYPSNNCIVGRPCLPCIRHYQENYAKLTLERHRYDIVLRLRVSSHDTSVHSPMQHGHPVSVIEKWRDLLCVYLPRFTEVSFRTHIVLAEARERYLRAVWEREGGGVDYTE